MAVLRRFDEPLTRRSLIAVLEGQELESSALKGKSDLGILDRALEELDPKLAASKMDEVLVEPVHRAIGISLRQASDMRIWHWLTSSAYPHVVWKRWRPEGVPGSDQIDEVLANAELLKRFLGVSSMAGLGRNTFARLWWTGERLKEGNSYDLARKALLNQDRFVQTSERFFGAYPPALKACIKAMPDSGNEDENRAAAKWLQQVLSTTALEVLGEDEIEKIVNEGLALES
jgi:hypothetical protein